METYLMTRLDHIAWRVPDKEKVADFYKSHPFNYKEAERFDIVFDDGSKANSIALVPPEVNKFTSQREYVLRLPNIGNIVPKSTIYHLAPEIFVSDGEPGSLIDKWVKERNGGGIHHIAYEVNNVEKIMKSLNAVGYEFTTEEPIRCPDDDLIQIFTKPISFMSNIIFEFIQRGDKGFCLSSVKKLMESTND